MKVCEFLLQKEGDRVWLPLEPPTVEILEGRYRIVARTPYPQTEVLVEVSYWSPEDLPPKRRTRHWNRHTNTKGIMPVLPFTTLQSGNWRVQCSSDLLTDMGEEGWQHVVELRVLAQEEDGDTWQRNSPAATKMTDSQAVAQEARGFSPEEMNTVNPLESKQFLEPEVTAAAQVSSSSDLSQPPVEETPEGQAVRQMRVEELRSLAEQMAHLVMDTVLEVGDSHPVPSIAPPVDDEETRDFFTVPEGNIPVTPVTALQMENQVSESPASSQTIASPEKPITTASTLSQVLPSGIQLQLKNNTIVPSAYSLFELYGYILTATGEPLQESPLPLQARVMLKNPSNMEVRLAMTQLLAVQPIHQPFYLSGHIALDWKNQLLLGEVQLQSMSLSEEDLTENVVTIATATFTIMPPVDALLTQVNPPEPVQERLMHRSFVENFVQNTKDPDAKASPSQPTPPKPSEESPPKRRISSDFLEVTRRSLASLLPNKPPTLDDRSQSASPAKTKLPPMLREPSPVQAETRSSPDLPAFVRPSPEATVPNIASQNTAGQNTADLNAESTSLPETSESLETVDEVLTDEPLTKPSAPSLGMEMFSMQNLGKTAPLKQGTDPNPDLSVDLNADLNADPGADLKQLTLLNLSEWTDWSVVPQEPDVRSPMPRKVIELPPVPSSVGVNVAQILNTLAEIPALAESPEAGETIAAEPEYYPAPEAIQPQKTIQPQKKWGLRLKRMKRQRQIRRIRSLTLRLTWNRVLAFWSGLTLNWMRRLPSLQNRIQRLTLQKLS